MNLTDEDQVMLISIIYQLLDNGADISNMNPYVVDYLQGLVDEFNKIQSQELSDAIYYFADTYFNKLNEDKNF